MTRRPLIKSAMTPFPFSVDAREPLAVARAMMEEHDFRHLPVTEGGELVGLVSARDLEVLSGEGGAAGDVEVGDICVDLPYIVDRNTALDAVLSHMAAARLESALVTREGKLVGVFTVVDACRGYARLLRELAGVGEDGSVA